MTLTLRLSAIREECKKIIELGERATPGPWHTVFSEDLNRTVCVSSKGWGPIAEIGGDSMEPLERQQTASFIASSRTFSPKAAQATIRFIGEYLDDMKSVDSVTAAISTKRAGFFCDQWEARG